MSSLLQVMGEGTFLVCFSQHVMARLPSCSLAYSYSSSVVLKLHISVPITQGRLTGAMVVQLISSLQWIVIENDEELPYVYCNIHSG